MVISREYTCKNPECGDGMAFLVFRKGLPKKHRQICAWCGHPAPATGKVIRMFSKNIIEYMNGVKGNVRPRLKLSS